MFWRIWNWPVRTLVSLGGFMLLAAFLLPVFTRTHESPRSSCQSNLRQIGLGFLQYAQDYDSYLPPVATASASYGWASALQPYLKTTRIYQCSAEPDQGQPDPRKSKYIDYWYNAQISGRSSNRIDDVATLLLAGDGNDGSELTDARYSLFALPAQWIAEPTSPSRRHLETANYLFADGHVKSFKPQGIAMSAPTSRPHFESR